MDPINDTQAAIKEKRKPASQMMEILAEDFLSEWYECRFNTVKGRPEIRQLGDLDFTLASTYKKNSLIREMVHHGIKISRNKLDEILMSDYAPERDPFRDYFDTIPPWDKEDWIRDLGETVIVANKEHWIPYFKKWIVATVANAINAEGCQNHTCLVLTGGQGKFKTTWIDLLTPPRLRAYSYTGKIKPNDKDAITLLAECFIINIDDQLKKLNKQDVDDLKELITKPSVKYRKPYDRDVMEYSRRASFIASVNEKDFLSDPTGSRRFLAFEVVQINLDKAKKINMDKIWSQAYDLYKSGFIYWFTYEEIQELNDHNMEFQMISTEEQLILEYFDIPEADSTATNYLQPAVALSYLERQSGIRNLSAKKLGEAFNRLGYTKTRKAQDKRMIWVYPVIKKKLEQVEAHNIHLDYQPAIPNEPF